ncbi:MAG: hypothetical protein EOP36_04245 [Rubrivivax sp.]|nr:MAG: hypothetical protein EOP36_04245 [Rubrivivax sp.]
MNIGASNRSTFKTMKLSFIPSLLLVCASLGTALLQGCTSVGRLDRDVMAPSANEAIYVLGLTPANHRAFIFPGELKDGVFIQDNMRAASYYGSSQKGYIVAKAKPSDVWAITNILVTESEAGYFGPGFAPCGGQNTITFKVPAGQVTYIGNVEFARQEKKLEVQYTSNFEAAKTYLEANYPNLRGLLQQGTFELAKVNRSCERPTITIPITVPRGR